MRRICTIILVSAVLRTPSFAQSGRCGGGTAQYLQTTGSDTVAAEGVAVDSTAIQSQLQVLKVGALRRHGVAFDPAITTRAAYVDIWQPGTEQSGPPTQHAQVKFSASAAEVVVQQGSRSQVQVDAVESGTLPFMSGSVLYLQLIAMRAAAVGRDSVRVPLLWLFSSGQLDTAHVLARGRDSVSIRMSGGEFLFARDADGTLGHGRRIAAPGSPSGETRYLRVCP